MYDNKFPHKKKYFRVHFTKDDFIGLDRDFKTELSIFCKCAQNYNQGDRPYGQFKILLEMQELLGDACIYTLAPFGCSSDLIQYLSHKFRRLVLSAYYFNMISNSEIIAEGGKPVEGY